MVWKYQQSTLCHSVLYCRLIQDLYRLQYYVHNHTHITPTFSHCHCCRSRTTHSSPWLMAVVIFRLPREAFRKSSISVDIDNINWGVNQYWLCLFMTKSLTCFEQCFYISSAPNRLLLNEINKWAIIQAVSPCNIIMIAKDCLWTCALTRAAMFSLSVALLFKSTFKLAAWAH